MTIFFHWSELQFFFQTMGIIGSNSPPLLKYLYPFPFKGSPLDKKYDVSSLLHFTFENILKYTALYLSTFLTINVYFFFLN